MYCTQCGTYNQDELTTCSNCGQEIKLPRTTWPSRPYTSPSSPPDVPYPGYQSSYSPDQPYQPYQSSYANQPPSPGGSASNRSIIAMVLSLIGIVACGPLTAIPGAILGRMEMNAIRYGKSSPSGLIMAKIGFYLGIAVSIFSCLFGLLWLLSAIASIML